MRRKGSPEELERRRYRAIQLLEDGYDAGEVAQRVGVERRSVRRWKAAEEPVTHIKPPWVSVLFPCALVVRIHWPQPSATMWSSCSDGALNPDLHLHLATSSSPLSAYAASFARLAGKHQRE